MSKIENKKVLITGAAGFLGPVIIRELLDRNPRCSIVAVDLRVPDNSENTDPRISWHIADISSLEQLQSIFTSCRPHAVIHAASLVPTLAQRYGRSIEQLVRRVNVEGTRNMLAAAKTAGTTAFVYTSSCTAVMDDVRHSYRYVDEKWPTSRTSSMYGESKAEAETFVQTASEDKFSTCILRPSVIFGPGDPSLIPSLHACIAKRETPYVIGDGLNLWDIAYVDNVALAHVLAVENLLTSKSAAGEIFFIQNNEPVPFRSIALAVWAQFGHIPPFELHLPRNVALAAGWAADCFARLTGAVPTLSVGSVLDVISVRYASGEKARSILGYEARVGLDEAIKITCEDFIGRLRESKDPAPRLKT